MKMKKSNMNRITSVMLEIGFIETESISLESQSVNKYTSSIAHETTPTCVTKWSKWINRPNRNKALGDYARLTSEQLQKLCPGGTIKYIECETTYIAAHDGNGPIRKCQSEKGMVCNVADALPVDCKHYKIRYYCLLGVSTVISTTASPLVKSTEPPTTPSPSLGKFIHPSASTTSGGQGFPTPAPTSVTSAEPTTVGQNSPTAAPPVCVTRWSTWINRNNPENHNGDYESLTPDELMKFCPGGSIKKVECQTTDGIPDYSTGAIQECTPEKGLVCNNADNFPVGCDNYEIRYYCLCGTNLIPSPTTAGKNKTHPPIIIIK